MPCLGTMALLVALASPIELDAQTASADSSGTAAYGGLALGFPASAREPSLSLVLVGYQHLQFRAWRPGIDIAVGSSPYVFAFGIMNLGGRVGLSLPLALTDEVVLLPSAGVGFVGAVTTDGNSGSAVGGYLGVSLVAISGSSRAIRIGVHRHELRDRELSGWLLEFALLSRRAQ